MLMHPAGTAVATQTRRCQFPGSGVDVNTLAGSMELMGTPDLLRSQRGDLR
jgi:hypothetical protein